MATKARISQISKGMFITSTMISFISEAQDEQQQNLVASLYDTTGILANFNETRKYSNALNCRLNANRLYINPGAFVSKNKRVINVPKELDTQIDITDEDWVYIRAEQQLTVPFTTLSGSVGSTALNFDVDANCTQETKDLATPGMFVIFKKDYDLYDVQGYEILSVSSDGLQLATPLLRDIEDEPFLLRTKVVGDDAAIDPETCGVFRWDTYEVATQNTGMAGHPESPDWILLARIYKDESDNLLVENIRALSKDEYTGHEALESFEDKLPNVANLKSTFTTSLLSQIREFFTTGKMKIGDFQVDLVGQLHYQNTDIGTSSSYFDICCSSGVLRIGDLTDTADYIARLYTSAPKDAAPTNYELPYVEGFTKTRLGCPDLPELRHASLGSAPADVAIDDLGTLNLTSESNIFRVVSGVAPIKNIQVSGNAKLFNGFQVTLLPTSPITFKSGMGNIRTSFSAGEATFNADEVVVFTQINGSWYLTSSGATGWNISYEFPEFQNEWPYYKMTIETTEDKTGELEDSIKELKENILKYAFPPKTILAVDLSDADIVENFDIDGLGKPDTRYDKWRICNGNGGTPNLQGRVLRMANQYMYCTNAISESNGGGVGWPTSCAGVAPYSSHPGSVNPTYSLSNTPSERYAGCHLSRLYIENLVPHKHPVPVMTQYTPEQFFRDNVKGTMYGEGSIDDAFSLGASLAASGMEPVLWEDSYGPATGDNSNASKLMESYNRIVHPFDKPDGVHFDTYTVRSRKFLLGGLSASDWTNSMSKYVHGPGFSDPYFSTVRWGDISRAVLLTPIDHYIGQTNDLLNPGDGVWMDTTKSTGGWTPDRPNEHSLFMHQPYNSKITDQANEEVMEEFISVHLGYEELYSDAASRQNKVLATAGTRDYHMHSGLSTHADADSVAPVKLGPLVYNAGDATIQRKNPVSSLSGSSSSDNPLRYEDSLAGKTSADGDNYPHPESRPFSIETPSYITMFLQLTV